MEFKDYFLKLYLGVGSCPSVDSYPPESKESLMDYDSLSVMFPLNESESKSKSESLLSGG